MGSRYQSSHPGKKTTKGLKISERQREKGAGGDIGDDEGLRQRGRRRVSC